MGQSERYIVPKHIKFQRQEVFIMNKADIIGEIADLKDIDYKNTLAIVSLIELLIEKKILTKKDISQKAQYLDGLTIEQLKFLNAKNTAH